jgi:N-acylneuraminate cytidylyltransferase
MIKNNPNFIAIIPARGGSKSIPRKNLKILGKHPLIAYSIETALRAKIISDVIVSTDDREIAEVSQIYGAQVPFIRPENLSQDETVDFPVIEHALKWALKNLNSNIDAVIQLRPTSPFRPKNLIDEATEIFIKDNEVDCVRGVTEATQTPYKMWKTNNGYLSPLIRTKLREAYNMPRQLLPNVYWQTGHIDIIRASTILEEKTLTGKIIKPVFIENKYCIDIDRLEDFEIANLFMLNQKLDIFLP